MSEQLDLPSTDENDIEDDTGADGSTRTVQNWSVEIQKTERSIFELHRRYSKKHLDVQPSFQRDFVWPLHHQTRLVESVLLRIPLPVIYLSEEDADRALVIDGQQRLTTLFRFMDDDLRLSGLSLLSNLNGSFFSDLDSRLQRRFEDTQLSTFVVQPGSHPEIKFEIFQRLNQGSVALNAQEIRNCLFQGRGLTLVKALSEPGSPFRNVAGSQRSYPRMRADELVLRCLAFIHLGLKSYRGDMLSFLNEALDALNKTTPLGRSFVRRLFRRSVARVEAIFGPDAFRRRLDDGRRSHALNAALMDVVIWGFAEIQRPLEFWLSVSDELHDRIDAIQQDRAFVESITYGTGDIQRVRYRFTLWLKELRNVTGN